jgi:hypothetical protein
MYAPENQSPPLGEGHALNAIRAKARNYRRAGTDVGEILQASQRLAHAQVRLVALQRVQHNNFLFLQERCWL